jgi:branched-chain amino acid transport system permease protein
MLYSACYGYTLEKIAYKPIRNAPRLSALISAIGMSLFCRTTFCWPRRPIFCRFPA